MKGHLFSFNTMLLMVLWSTTVFAAGECPLLRFPDVHGDQVVFAYGEDLWKSSTSGGNAIRLTFHDGNERFPKFSPDGKLIAFTAEYDGNEDVYVMNTDGGNIRRVTFHPGQDEVVGWHPLKNKIIFSSGRNSFNRFIRLYLIAPDGTGLEELLMHEASNGSFSADGKRIAYTRSSREWRTWKRYRGGRAQEIYLLDLETKNDRNLTNHAGTDRIPMWIGDKIYFSSDRDRRLNIYAYDVTSGTTEQVTHHSDYDVRRPSQGGAAIVYEVGGSLWLLDTTTGNSHQIPIVIGADAEEARPRLVNVDEMVTGFDSSPSGSRALVIARGEVFTVPRENGNTRNITNDSGARDKDAAWSPDGKSIAYLSDKSGEYDIYVVDAKGATQAIQLTNHKDGYRHTLRWSPDGKKIAFADQTLSCFILDIKSKKITKVDKSDYENVDVALDVKLIYDFKWSPDSRFLAYSKMNADLLNQIYIYSLESNKSTCVSDGLFNDFNPVFTPNGMYLLFVSNRRFDPTFCDFEWEMVYKKVAGVYAMALEKDTPSFLPALSDEEGSSNSKPAEKSKKTNIKIDFDGIQSRIESLPLPRGNYRSLAVSETAVFYMNSEEGDYNRFEFRALPQRTVFAYLLDDREEITIIEKADGFKLSADGNFLVYQDGKNIGFAEVGSSQIEHIKGQHDIKKSKLDLTGLKMQLDPRAEWQQMFNETWRMERDFYYEPKMHGIDWTAMKIKYGKMLPFASCRQDLGYIIGELIGELNTSHTYVYGGDENRKGEEISTGMLGADWESDARAGRYRIKKIYNVADWTREILPPLSGPGINVNPGDYLIQVNGVDVTTDKNIYSYFCDMSDKFVTLLFNDKPVVEGAREVTVKTMRSESTLRYLDWVEHNRKVANELSGGQIGYLHLPDTYTGSASEFPKYFYSQTQKKGIIVDGRFNGGGLDPDIFLQRLAKPVMSYWTRRYSHDQRTPTYTTRAHMVCLTNKYAGSGGDELPYEFQQKKMGPVIGTRTWGGLVGVSMFISLVDGGSITAPDYRIYDVNGKWVVENEGVTPDIIVDLTPEEMERGYDAQLMKGIEVLLEKIKNEPRPWPQHEAYPVDSE
ncbi:MAG: peptidase S41 [Calditrichales bacterium]|nr:MAG: peptidase S41 [Calditrichales bacterium]